MATLVAVNVGLKEVHSRRVLATTGPQRQPARRGRQAAARLRAQRGAREIQAGCVWVNDHLPFLSEMPHGGFKESGYGKDLSVYALEDYTRVKHAMIKLD